MVLHLVSVVWSALERLAGGRGVAGIQPRVGQGDGRVERGSRVGPHGYADGGRDVPGHGMSSRFEQPQPLIEPAGRRPAVLRAGDHLRSRLGTAFGQAVARYHEAGGGAD